MPVKNRHPGGNRHAHAPFSGLAAAAFVFALFTGMTPLAVAQKPSRCEALFQADVFSRSLSREQIVKLTEQLKQPLKPGQLGVRILTWEEFDTADAEKPLRITLPNGREKILIGLSGQNIILVDQLADLERGGLIDVQKIRLFNEHGIAYGEEDLDYAFSSGTWDAAVVPNPRADEDGYDFLIYAGAMDNRPDGRPMTIEDNFTRQRRVFFARFEQTGGGEFTLVGRHPQTLFGYKKPDHGNWLELDKNGNILFAHGYGGTVLTLPNGDLYADPQGRHIMFHEQVVEQREIPDAAAPGGRRKVPYRTAIFRTYLDGSLTRSLGPSEIVMDVFDSNGQPYRATERIGGGQLVEGPHVEVMYQGRPVQSQREIESLRARGAKLSMRMLFSSGDFFSRYGSHIAYAESETADRFHPVENADGQLYDMTAPLEPLFTWLGRPVFYEDSSGRERILVHGVARSSIPEDVPFHGPPPEGMFDRYKRRILTFPVERFEINGQTAYRILDTTGLMETLKSDLF